MHHSTKYTTYQAIQIFFVGLLLSSFLFLTASTRSAHAVELNNQNADAATAATELSSDQMASNEAEATSGATTTAEKTQDKTDKDITQTTSKQKSELEAFLDQQPAKPLSWHNGLQHAIRGAISRGLPANIVVLILLFPVIASVIALSRHVIGLQGFGIYTPAVLSIALVSTGISTGLALFLVILLTTIVFRKLNVYLRVQYLPRTAMLLWGVSLAILLFLILASYGGLTFLLNITIFPLLILMLLSENFVETQLSSSQSQAIRLTIETVLIAVFCSLIISQKSIQEAALLNPELLIIAVAAINTVVGKYSGLRLLEYIRFKSIIEG